MPLPFLPIHILWINLITDGLPAVALSVDPKDPEIMRRKPRDPKEGILAKTLLFVILAGAVACLASILVFVIEYTTTMNVAKARTVAFTTAMFFELFFVFNCRSETHSVFSNPPWTNKKLIISVIASIVLQFFIIYVPFLQPIFKTTALNWVDWARILMFSGVAVLIMPRFFIPQNKK